MGVIPMYEMYAHIHIQRMKLVLGRFLVGFWTIFG